MTDLAFTRIEGVCEACAQPMQPGRGCTLSSYLIQPTTIRQEHIRQEAEGDVFDPLTERYRFGDDFAYDLEQFMQPPGYCRSCQVAEGQYHHPGCTVERCPFCAGQAAGCRCHKEWP